MKAEILWQARQLRATYTPKYAFPRWVCDAYIEQHFDSYESDAGASSIFFDEGDSLGQVLMLASQREPVNIGMCRMYDQARFASVFGWQTGGYGALADGVADVPPNIAIMCPTPIVSGLSGPDADIGEKAKELCDPSKRVYVLNVIAYAFDSAQQPDQLYFLDGGQAHITDAKRKELAERFGRIFDKVFAAALHYDRKVIVLSKFGAGAFSEYYPGNLFEEVWLPAFLQALEAWTPQLRAAGVTEVSLMGGEESAALADAVREAGFLSELYTFFPDPLRKQLGDRLEEAVLVNAWDSWSLIGNGNFADRSLDGFVGRATALAVLGWPVTNPWLKDNVIPVKRPSLSSKL